MEAQVYKTRLPVRLAVGLAGVLWTAVLVVLLLSPGAEAQAILGAAAFAAFFAGFTFVYLRTSITVTPDGIVASTPLRGRRPVPFRDIVEIVVEDGLAGRVYAVFTRAGLVQFTSLFARHGELFELLRERAELVPRAR
jgi:hypothetical protein